MTHTDLPIAQRRLLTFFMMAAAVMNQVDVTIANVAMPHIQGSTSASREQIGWVLTSYIISMAIFTPLSGWLASRFGRRRLILTSIACFTIASGLCGMAVNLEELIIFRMIQGMSGAALVPMSQATLLDSYPVSEHGKAMSIFGLGAIAGPLAGPLMGGWITDNMSWRWVFLINMPIGTVATLGLLSVMPRDREGDKSPLDLVGFGLLSVAIGSMQLMLDRGQLLDWFQSTEIWVEACVAATSFYLFLIHSFTAKNPFVTPAVFADRNFLICTTVGLFLGVLLYGPMALIPQMLEGLMGYPTMEVGLSMAPRGIGVLFAMLVLNRIIGKIDYRILVATGMLCNSLAMLHMSQFSLQADNWIIVTSGFVQGMGSTIIFVPLSALAFSTLPVTLRNEAAAMNTLIRNIGGAIGIALVQVMTIRNAAIVRSRLAEGVRPDNPPVASAFPGLDLDLPSTAGASYAEIARQAMMVSYVDAFRIMFIIAMVGTSLAFLLRPPRRRA